MIAQHVFLRCTITTLIAKSTIDARANTAMVGVNDWLEPQVVSLDCRAIHFQQNWIVGRHLNPTIVM